MKENGLLRANNIIIINIECFGGYMRFFFYALLLPFLLLMYFSGSAAAEKWELLYEDRELSFFIDADSVFLNPDGSKLSRDKFVFKKPQCDAPFALKKTQCYQSVISVSKYFNDQSSCALNGRFLFTDGASREIKFACTPKKFDTDSYGDLEWKYLFHSASQGTE